MKPITIKLPSSTFMSESTTLPMELHPEVASGIRTQEQHRTKAGKFAARVIPTIGLGAAALFGGFVTDVVTDGPAAQSLRGYDITKKLDYELKLLFGVLLSSLGAGAASLLLAKDLKETTIERLWSFQKDLFHKIIREQDQQFRITEKAAYISGTEIFEGYDKALQYYRNLPTEVIELLRGLYLDAVMTGNASVVEFVHQKASPELRDSIIKNLDQDQMKHLREGLGVMQKAIDAFEKKQQPIDLNTKRGTGLTGVFLSEIGADKVLRHSYAGGQGRIANICVQVSPKGRYDTSFNFDRMGLIEVAGILGKIDGLKKDFPFLAKMKAESAA